MSWDPFPDDPTAGEPSEDTAAAERLARHIELQLPGLVSRRVPVRGIIPGPVDGVGRLRLADSTTYLVSSVVQGDIGRIVRALHHRYAVTIASWERNDDALMLTLAGVPGRAPARLWLLGPDQPD